MVQEIMCKSTFQIFFKGECQSFHARMMKHLIKSLLSSYFNIAANNFTLVLNRRQVEKNNIKMVKELKKDRNVNSQIKKNDD